MTVMATDDPYEPPDPDADLPLSGVRVLALEQMQALPFATQLLARLGADVVKVEPPEGDSGRGSLPAVLDPQGRRLGATFLRGNLNKRSVCINLKDERGRQLVFDLASKFDVIASNARPGVMARFGLDYDAFAAVNPRCIYATVSGFGTVGNSPYQSWPAYAPIVEAMSGIYEMKRTPGQPPTASPVGALGDISAALFTTIGILAALRHRDQTGRGQHVDVAMLDAVMAMTDVVTNFWSLGLVNGDSGPVINHGFRARDGWFVLQIAREAHFAKFARLIEQDEWLEDERFATRRGWLDHLESDIRPALEKWAHDKTRLEVCETLAGAELAAGPCLRDDELSTDPHVMDHRMLVGIHRPDGNEQPVLVVGNPIKLSDMPERNDARPPWIGEHTDSTLAAELGLEAVDLDVLRAQGVIT